MSIFNVPDVTKGRGNPRLLDDEELLVAHTYVLRNTPEVDPTLSYFKKHYQNHGLTPEEIDKKIDKEFADYYRRYVSFLLVFFSKLLNKIGHS